LHKDYITDNVHETHITHDYSRMKHEVVIINSRLWRFLYICPGGKFYTI